MSLTASPQELVTDWNEGKLRGAVKSTFWQGKGVYSWTLAGPTYSTKPKCIVGHGITTGQEDEITKNRTVLLGVFVILLVIQGLIKEYGTYSHNQHCILIFTDTPSVAKELMDH